MSWGPSGRGRQPQAGLGSSEEQIGYWMSLEFTLWAVAFPTPQLNIKPFHQICPRTSISESLGFAMVTVRLKVFGCLAALVRGFLYAEGETVALNILPYDRVSEESNDCPPSLGAAVV